MGRSGESRAHRASWRAHRASWQAHRASWWARQVGWQVCHQSTPVNHQGVTPCAFPHQVIPFTITFLQPSLLPGNRLRRHTTHLLFIVRFIYLTELQFIGLFVQIKRNMKSISFPAPMGCESQPVPPNTASNGQDMVSLYPGHADSERALPAHHVGFRTCLSLRQHTAS